MDRELEATKAVEAAKKMIMEKKYRDARDCMRLAMGLNPSSTSLFPMWVVAETLYYGDIDLPNCGIDCYSVLHLSPSADKAAVEDRFNDLAEDVTLLTRVRFPGAIEALSILVLAKCVLCNASVRCVYDRRRKGTVQFEWPNVIKRSALSRKNYLNWKEPIYVFDASEHMKSLKKRRPSDQNPPCVDVEGDPVLSPEFRALRKQVFDEMPQRPHYAPLQKYSERVRKGMIMGFDVAFVNLSEEIRKLSDPQKFLSTLEDFNSQVSQLEEMGYNVEMLKDRLYTLQRTAERGVASQIAVKIVEEEVKDKLVSFQTLISEYEAKIKESMVFLADRELEIQTLKKDSSDALTEFTSTAKSSWN